MTGNTFRYRHLLRNHNVLEIGHEVYIRDGNGKSTTAIEMTAPITEFGTDLRRWDLAYQKRARQCGVFLACQPQFIELYNPPAITLDIMQMAFNRVPGTQNPPAISIEEFDSLKHLCGI